MSHHLSDTSQDSHGVLISPLPNKNSSSKCNQLTREVLLCEGFSRSIGNIRPEVKALEDGPESGAGANMHGGGKKK